jgi:hypothetical protein
VQFRPNYRKFWVIFPLKIDLHFIENYSSFQTKDLSKIKGCLDCGWTALLKKIEFCFSFILLFLCFCIVLMCWCQKWVLKNEKKILFWCISKQKALWKTTSTTLPNKHEQYRGLDFKQNRSRLTMYWMEGFDCKQNTMQKDSNHQISSKKTQIIKWPYHKDDMCNSPLLWNENPNNLDYSWNH